MEGLRGEFEGTVVPLLRGILEDTQKLFRQELALVKVEVQEDARRARTTLVALSVAVLLALVGVFLLGCMGALLVASAFPALPAWAGFGVVAMVSLIGGVVSAAVARRSSRRLRLEL
jgi:uncharacterized membrane protein YqjE